MKEFLAKACLVALMLWLLTSPPRAQMQVGSGRAIISQGGNDAAVSSAGALSANITQFGGAAAVTGTGASGSGIPRVTVSNDSQVKPWDGANSITVKAASATPVAADTALVVGLSPNTLGCAGQSIANTKKAAFSQTASAQIITGAASKQTYICSMLIYSATAQSVNLVEGTGTTCATGIAGLTGGTTAATGMSLAAATGVSRGVGTGLTTFTATAASNVCLLQSSTGQVSGVIIYTQF